MAGFAQAKKMSIEDWQEVLELFSNLNDGNTSSESPRQMNLKN